MSAGGVQAPGRRLPSGLVTFVFTDIEGSTLLLRRLGDLGPEAMELHRRLLRAAWSETGGVEVSTEGDSFFVAYDDTDAAVAGCVRAQQLIADAAWPEGWPVRVRMGIHVGPATPRDDDYIALAVHQASRVMQAAHGGQILISAAAAARLGTVADGHLVDLGVFRLRDFDEPERLTRVDPVGREPVDRHPRATPADGHNLIRPPTTFHDRVDERREIAAMLQPGTPVTLTGAGGIGKTRLAIEVGFDVCERWDDGVWMVELADVTDPGLVAVAIGTATGAPSTPGSPAWEDVRAHLAQRRCLLVLDDADAHVEILARLVPELLGRCPTVGVLTTSREPLNVPGEIVCRVEPLAVPEPGSDPDRIVESAAAALFCERALRANPALALDAGTVAAVARICARLDGLPLALEIAAARARVISVHEVLDGLEDRFRLLRSRDRTRPDRHRTIEGLLDWSHRLLAQDERVALRRLGVFGGSFTADAARVVVGDDDLDAGDAAELLWTLVDKSLVVADLGAAETRYRLSESVREYALAKLRAADEVDAVADRLGRWFLERVAPHRPVDRAWLSAVEAELANLRVLVGHLAGSAPALAQQLACTIARRHDAVQAFAVGIDELSMALEQVPEPTPARVGMLTALADLHLRRADVDRARELVTAAQTIALDVGPPPWDPVAVERTAGEIALRSGDPARAATIALAAVERDLPPVAAARMQNLLGIARYEQGDLAGAATAFEGELDAYLAHGHEATAAGAHGNIAEMALQLGDTARAARHQRATLESALELAQPVMLAYSFIVAARLAAAGDAWEQAVRLLGLADSLLDEAGHELYPPDRAQVDAVVEAARQRLGEARSSVTYGEGRRADRVEAAALAFDIFTAAMGDSDDSVTATGTSSERGTR